MNYWIFPVVRQESYDARQIYERRMEDRFWGLSAGARNRKAIRKGDEVAFYIGDPEKAFAGAARLASDFFVLNREEQSKLSHGSPTFTAECGVWLDAISKWEKSRPIAELAPNLTFVTNPLQPWIHLRGGIRQVGENDYVAITTGVTPPEASVHLTEKLASQSLFALEAHLEDFIERNWPKISWGAPLELYREEEQTGRQFPAGPWTIDFLAVDRKANELVVIELKRGQASDATVGQVRRYINWVRENVAKQNQKVRGIIVANEVDDALRYAARGLPDVSVMTYKVMFSLQAEEI